MYMNFGSYSARTSKFTAVFLILFGLVFVAAGFGVSKSLSIDKTWHRTNGTVISYTTDRSTDSDGSTSDTHEPVVSYSVNGQTYQVTGTIGSSSVPKIGSTKQVAYDPSNPANAKVVESGATKALFWIFPVAGIIVASIGVFSLFKRSNPNAVPAMPGYTPATGTLSVMPMPQHMPEQVIAPTPPVQPTQIPLPPTPPQQNPPTPPPAA